MKVRELIALLERHAEKNPEVVVTWETTRSPIEADEIYLSADGELVIDADGNSYKELIQSKPGWLRGEDL